MLEQLQFALWDKQQGSFSYNDLDAQCSNYQFFSQYTLDPGMEDQ
jgi:hypothetical protein